MQELDLQRGNTDLLLNLQLIHDELEHPSLSLRLADTLKRGLEDCRLYYGQDTIRPSYVYVTDRATLLEHPVPANVGALVCLGDLPDGFNLPVLEVRGALSLAALFERVQEIFTRFRQLDSALRGTVVNGEGINACCAVAMEILRNPLFVHDEQFNILAMPKRLDGMASIVTDHETGMSSLGLDDIARLQNSDSFSSTMDTRGAHQWVSLHGTHKTMYVNLWDDRDQFRGRLLLYGLETPFKPSHSDLAEYCANLICKALMQRPESTTSGYCPVENYLRQLVDGEAIKEGVVLHRFAMRGWNRKDQYCLFRMVLSKRDISIISASRFSSNLCATFSETLTFNKDNEIFAVRNLTRAETTMEECREQLERFGAKMQIQIGLSCVFEDLLQVKDFALEADQARRMGRVKKPGYFCYAFADWIVYYIVEHFIGDLRAENICCPGLLKLRSIDREKNTAYIETLRAYFANGFQQLATAEALFIHRSTLTYRLERISQLGGIDLENADQRLYAQLSLMLLELIPE